MSLDFSKYKFFLKKKTQGLGNNVYGDNTCGYDGN